MIAFILVLLIALWLLGFINLPFLPISDINIINLFGHMISLYDILIFVIILWVVGVLPGVFRTIASLLLVVWLLSFFGVIAITGLSSVVVLVVIFGLVYYLLTGGH
jgi:hypothetical protein